MTISESFTLSPLRIEYSCRCCTELFKYLIIDHQGLVRMSCSFYLSLTNLLFELLTRNLIRISSTLCVIYSWIRQYLHLEHDLTSPRRHNSPLSHRIQVSTGLATLSNWGVCDQLQCEFQEERESIRFYELGGVPNAPGGAEWSSRAR